MLAAACLAWTAATTSVAAWAALRRSRRAPTCGSAAPPSVGGATLLLRPCAGAEPGLERALLSSAAAPLLSRARFLVEREEDGATPAARRAAASLGAQGRDARVVVTGARAANRKADQIARALAQEDGDYAFVVIADSDVALSPALLAAVVGPLAAREASAVWAPPVEVAAATAGDRASQAVLDASLHAFSLLGALDPAGMVGKCVALRRDALEAAGGFGPLAACLGEDMELARRLRAAGAPPRAAALTAPSLAAGRTLGDVVRRYARWVAVIRAQRPALLPSYPLLFAAAPLQLALAVAATATEGAAGLVAAAAVLAARWTVAAAARASSGRPVLRALGLAPWRADAVLLAAFAVALSTRTVRWRGVALRVEGGRIVADADP